MRAHLTPRQREVLSFINRFREAEQCNPTMREIAHEFRWSSGNASHTHMVALFKKGVVTYRESGRYLVNFAWCEVAAPTTSRAPACALPGESA